MRCFVFWETPPELLAKAAPLYAELAALRMQRALVTLARKYNFNPSQPRVPEGDPNGGRWTGASGSGWARVAANDERQGGVATDASPRPSNIQVPSHIPQGADIDRNIREAKDFLENSSASPTPGVYTDSSELTKYAWFYSRVHDGGSWDYKTNGHPEDEDFGNFNYGATGKALGIGEDVLLRMAGRQQVIDGTSQPDWGVTTSLPAAVMGVGGIAPFGDDPKDQAWIKRGFQYYYRYAATLSR
jgi:hypothetical protein